MPQATPSFRPGAGLQELLDLAGQKYELEFEQVSAGGVTLDILQIANMRQLLDKAIAENRLADAVRTLPLWAKIWPASVILAHLVSQLPREGRSVLEVGAGCGVTGLMAAAFGFERVVISDIDEDALLFARINVLKNNLHGCAEVRRVDIRHDAPSDDPKERFSLVLGAEILYLDDLYRPLVKFLKRHLAPQGSEALLASDHRRGAKAFFKRAEKEFQVSHKQIGFGEKSAEGERAERHLLALHRLTPRALSVCS